MTNIEELKQHKYDLIGWYKFTKDKAIRKELRLIDKKIKDYYELRSNDTSIS